MSARCDHDSCTLDYGILLNETTLTAEEKEVDQRRLGDQHLEKIYRQEESAGARKRQSFVYDTLVNKVVHNIRTPGRTATRPS